MIKIGFIGCGNMGSALAIAAEKAKMGEILLCNRSPEKAAALAAKIGGRVATATEIAAECHYIFLGVKPYQMDDLLTSLRPTLEARQEAFALISMAAGKTLAALETAAGKGCPLIRIMPNTPVEVGAGLIQYCTNQAVTAAQEADFRALMANAGVVDAIDEGLIDAASALSGCGPAFVCLFAEALADGAVSCGLPREKALRYAALTLSGTGALLSREGAHPGPLKDAVCSPGGSTIAGVAALEDHAFRAAAIAAVRAAFDRTKKML